MRWLLVKRDESGLLSGKYISPRIIDDQYVFYRLHQFSADLGAGELQNATMETMPHLVLLGDSIFDNGVYTSGGPDVVSQARKLLPSGWEASLLAVDGATTDNIADQVARLPAGATHLVLSVGGNNPLTQASKLRTSFFPD